MTPSFFQNRFLSIKSPAQPLLIGLMAGLLISGSLLMANAQDASINTGMTTSSNIGNQNATCADTGTCINGGVTDSTLTNVQTSVSTGSNQNVNTTNLNPILYNPSASSAAGGASSGGNSAVIMPRNPLMMQNALFGRKAFQLQFGANNNPGLSSLMGSSNALGWFAQAGLSIPFGKVPDVLTNQQNRQMDDVRAQRQNANRNVFGQMANANTVPALTSVYGQVMVPPSVQGGLNAYNYGTIPAQKIQMPDMQRSTLLDQMIAPTSSQPKVIALEPSEAFTHPLNTGDKVGLLEVGREYPYLGHTKSGWVKVLLPKGVEAWSQSHFEYIKNDYTEVDNLAFDTIPAAPTAKALTTNKVASAKSR